MMAMFGDEFHKSQMEIKQLWMRNDSEPCWKPYGVVCCVVRYGEIADLVVMDASLPQAKHRL